MRAGKPNRRTAGSGPLEIVIRRDGEVVFRTFTDEMLNVAGELAPDDPKVRARLERRERARRGGPHGPVADR